MNRMISIGLFGLIISVSCSKKAVTTTTTTTTTTTPAATDTLLIRGADLSFLPEIEQAGTVFYNKNNVAKDALTILKDNGCNTVRIRLWHTPAGTHSALPEVTALAQRVRAAGLKVWLDFHYSDTWTDPGQQATPVAWQAAGFSSLKDSVYNYTTRVMSIIQPDYVQIGNELNDGFLWETGRIAHLSNFMELIKKGCAAARIVSPSAKIIIHFAGLNNSTWFYDQLRNNSVDYDIIGLSYYPIYHGLVLNDVKTTLDNLSAANNKPVVIAETSYPFTLGYNDYTNNLVGLPSQIIPDYPATPDGQKNYLLALKSLVKQSAKGVGFCYWGTEWVAFKGPTATDGSSYENQALFDFNNTALPAMEVFNP